MTNMLDQPSNESAAAALAEPNEFLDMLGGRLERVARVGEDGSVLFRTSVAPGQTVPLHSHIDPECFYVLTGRLEVFLLDSSPRWHLLSAGRSVVMTDGIKHAIRNPARASADIMVMTNARLAAFFRDSGRPAKRGSDLRPVGPQDVEHVGRIARDYGYWLSSPAEHAAITGEVASLSGP